MNENIWVIGKEWYITDKNVKSYVPVHNVYLYVFNIRNECNYTTQSQLPITNRNVFFFIFRLNYL